MPFLIPNTMKREWDRRAEFTNIKKDWVTSTNKDGRFLNIHDNLNRGIKSPFDWKIKISQLLKNRKKEGWEDNSVQLQDLNINKSYFMIWLGHSSFYLYLNGLKILIDPVFGSVPFVKRITKLPINTSNFRDIDYILISHDHYDHLDKKSIKTVLQQSKSTKIICGAGTEKILSKLNVVGNEYEIISMQWYDKYRYDGFKVTFLPSLHWSRRGMNDGCKRLWGAFMIQFGGINMYFSGDTTYGDHFKEVKELFGNVDYAIIGIGAFRPRAHTYRNHISPREAIRASQDIQAGKTIPMHYNTFDLSKEKYMEPLSIFQKAAQINNVDTQTPKIGEVLELIINKSEEAQKQEEK